VEVRPVTVDMADPEVDRLVAAATDDLEVGLMIYNAAGHSQGPFLTAPVEQLRNVITVSCLTPTLLVKGFAAPMVARGHGGIVLVTSTGGLQGIKMLSAYGASKAYELILGEGLWDEFRDHGVDACAYVVGATATPTYIETFARIAPEKLAAFIGDGDGGAPP